MLATELSVVEVLASATGSEVDDWQSLDGPESGVGVDYWFRNRAFLR